MHLDSQRCIQTATSTFGQPEVYACGNKSRHDIFGGCRLTHEHSSQTQTSIIMEKFARERLFLERVGGYFHLM